MPVDPEKIVSPGDASLNLTAGRPPSPLLPAALAFMLGIILTDLFHPSTVILSVLSISFIAFFNILWLLKKSASAAGPGLSSDSSVLIGVFYLRSSVITSALICGLCLIAGGLRLKAFYHQPANHLKNFETEKAIVRVTGRVIGEVAEKSYPDKIGIGLRQRTDPAAQGGGTAAENVSKNYSVQSASFLLKTEQISAQNTSAPAEGLLKVNTYNFIPEVNYGDKIELLGRIYSPAGPTNPGQFDYRRYLRQQGIYKMLSVAKPEDIKIIKKESGNLMLAAIFKSREYLSRQFNRSFANQTYAAFLNALVLGKRETLPEELENKFIQTGTVHILAVSGLNVAIVISVFLFILWLVGIRGRARAIILILIIIFYAGLTGFNIPVVRASIMALTFAGAELFKRKSNMINNLAFAALVILLWNPNDIFNTGFQLSFLAVLAIIIFSGPFRLIFPEENKSLLALIPQTLPQKLWRWLKLYCYNAFAVSCAAWLGVAPLVLAYFNIITPVTILVNILIAPLIFLILSAGLFILPFLCLGITIPFVPVTAILIGLLELILDWTLKIPAGYFFLPDIPVWLVLLYYAFLGLWIFLIPSKKACPVLDTGRGRGVLDSEELAKPNLALSGRGLSETKWLLAPLAIWLIIFVLWLSLPPARPAGLKLTMLDVKQGAAFFLEFPDGQNCLYDAGATGTFDVGENIISQYLWHKKITKIDTLILSHPHLDHINGVPALLERFKIGRIIVSPYFEHLANGRSLLRLIQNKNIGVEKIETGNHVPLADEVSGQVLGPPTALAKLDGVNENDLSLVLKINYRDKSLLLTGDIKDTGIDWLMNSGRPLDSTVLVIPHHGYAASLTSELIQRVNPRHVLINANGYNVDDESVESARANGAGVWTSYRHGAVTLKFLSDRIETDALIKQKDDN